MCQLTHKEDKGMIEEEKAHAQAKPSPGRKQDTKNEDPITHPCHKRLRMNGRTGNKDQTSPQAMANVWMANKLWTHIEVEHAQGSCTTYLYPANTGVVGHRSEVRNGIVWRWGEEGSLFWGFCLHSFGENVLLEWHTTQKKGKMSWNH